MNDIATLPGPTVRSTALTPRTYAEALQFAEMMAQSSMVPTEYYGKPANILLALQLGAELGMAPLQAIQSIATINGKPCVYGDAALALVRASRACEDVIERFEGDGDSLTAICEAKRVGKAPVVARFSIADAKRAALFGKQGPWQQYPRRMLQMRARGFALRDAFPDVLRGVITREEAEDYPVDVSKQREMVDATPKADLDAFAGPTEPAIVALARAEARKGTASFRGFLKALSQEEFAAVKPLLGSRDKPGELTLLAMQADEDRDPFGLPPLDEPAAPSGGGGSPGEPHSPAGPPTGKDDAEAKRSEPEAPHSAPAGEYSAAAALADIAACETGTDLDAWWAAHAVECGRLSIADWRLVNEAIEKRRAEIG